MYVYCIILHELIYVYMYITGHTTLIIPIKKYPSKMFLLFTLKQKYFVQFKFHAINFHFLGKNGNILMTKNQICGNLNMLH